MILKRAPERKPEINMVPMIDVVFQLIIFFLVATQVKKNVDVMELVLPTARKPEEIKPEQGDPPFVVNIVKPEVAKDRPYYVMAHWFTLKEFEQLLKNRRAFYKETNKPMPIMRIRADRDSEFKDIQDALIACRDVGIWQVRITALKREK